MEPKYFESLYPETTRFEEIKKVIEKIRSGRSCQVIGAPGVGKGSMLRLLPYNKEIRTLHLGGDEEKFHFVYMDFSEVKDKPLSDIVKFILISLSYSLSERDLTEEHSAVNKFLKEAIAIPDEMVLFQGLKKAIDYLANERDFTIVLLIDRFEEYIANVNPEFFSYLKILRNRAKYKFAVAIAATRPLEEMIEPQILGEFYEFLAGNIVYLALCDKTGIEFRLSHLEEITKKNASKELKEEILKLSAGHGKIARICYEMILAEPPGGGLKEFLMHGKQVRAALFEIWRFLTPEEKSDIRAEEKNELLENLEITKNGKATIPLFGEFVKSVSESTTQKIVYDNARNEIKRSDEDLGELLSPSEFRLLKFLLINEGRICEKDEIINNVWQESKTQEGVTDQALDQIIYRLRKKLERDPNAPTLIQTIKGRGYKLAQ